MRKKNPRVGSSFDEFLREEAARGEAASVNLDDRMKRLAAARRSKVERRAARLIAEEAESTEPASVGKSATVRRANSERPPRAPQADPTEYA